jgi:hypothetical protein
MRITYELRPDVRMNFRAGFRRVAALRGKAIELLVNRSLVRCGN